MLGRLKILCYHCIRYSLRYENTNNKNINNLYESNQSFNQVSISMCTIKFSSNS